MKKQQKKKMVEDYRKQVIEVTSNLMNVEYVPVEDVQELEAIERGDGWVEGSVEKHGLVRCTSPIKGTVYRVRVFGSPLDVYYPKAMVTRLLASKKGRVFANAEGALRIALDLPKVELDRLLTQIMVDAYEMAGYRVCGTEE